MTGTEVALVIGNIATLITAISGFVVLLRKTEVIHKATNGMHRELNELTAKSAKLEGQVEGKAEGIKEEKEAEAARKSS